MLLCAFHSSADPIRPLLSLPPSLSPSLSARPWRPLPRHRSRVRLHSKGDCRYQQGGQLHLQWRKQARYRRVPAPPLPPPKLLPLPHRLPHARRFSLPQARQAHAPSSSSWLWGGGESTRGDGFFGDGAPPGTPLAMPPPRTPRETPRETANGMRHGDGRGAAATPMSASLVTPMASHAAAPAAGGGGGGGEAILREKVNKLRWLLQMANTEIQRLKELAGEGATSQGGSCSGSVAQATPG